VRDPYQIMGRYCDLKGVQFLVTSSSKKKIVAQSCAGSKKISIKVGEGRFDEPTDLDAIQRRLHKDMENKYLVESGLRNRVN